MRFCHPFRNGIPLFRAGHQRVTHPFATNVLLHPFDLHVLGTPPAFILSQDQTLRIISSGSSQIRFISLQSSLRNCLVCFLFLLLLNCQGARRCFFSRFPCPQRQEPIICISFILSRAFLYPILSQSPSPPLFPPLLPLIPHSHHHISPFFHKIFLSLLSLFPLFAFFHPSFSN